jgi:hypothetical protein
VSVLAIDLSAMVIGDPNRAIRRLQALGKVEPDLAGRSFEVTFNRRLRPLKPAMSEREADAERPGNKRRE